MAVGGVSVTAPPARLPALGALVRSSPLPRTSRAPATPPALWSTVVEALTRPYRVTAPMVLLVALVPLYIFIAALLPGRELHVPDLPLDRFSPRLRFVAHFARRMPASTKATRSPRRLRTMKSPRMGRSHARVRVTERSSASRGRARSSLHGVLRSDTNREDLHRWEASGTDSESHSFESRTPVTTRHHRDERNLPQR